MTTATVPLVDLLPSRQGYRCTVRWFAGTLSGCGVVELDGKRDATSYTVVEFPCHWEGRSFRLAKVVGTGTDTTETAYSVFCSADGRAASRCECKGFARWRHCRHLDTVTTLIGNCWL